MEAKISDVNYLHDSKNPKVIFASFPGPGKIFKGDFSSR
jgi:hypothetical protein